MAIYNANATYTGKDQNHQDETTVYWFEVEALDDRILSGTYGVSDCNGELTAVFDDGAPIDCDELLAKAVLDLCEITDEAINDF